MGFLLLFSKLTFFGLKLGHYFFLAAVRSLWHLFNYANRRLWEVGRSRGSRSITTPNVGSSGTSSRSSRMPSISAGQTASSPRDTLVQFLNNILSTRGPTNLPYQEDVKYYVRQHLLELIKDFQGLQIKTATFNHNDGRTSYLLQVAGTIPMFFKDVNYNVPITMWLVEAYPRVAPLVFVTPTRGMIIKPHHRCVDASGTVTVPYLQQWSHPRSNLAELVRSLSLVFGEDPPLYSRPPSAPQRTSSAVPTTPPPSRAASQSIHATTNPLHSSSGQTSPGPLVSPAAASPNRVSRPPPYTVDSSSPGSSSRLPTQVTTPEEAFQINAINTLTERLQRDSKAAMRRGSIEMDDLFNTQVLLNERKEQMEQGLRDMKREKESLEEQLQLYLTNTDVIEAWLRQNDADKSEFVIDEVFQPVDALSRQLLESIAADLTIEDALYSLDRAVQDGSVPWDVYHKAVRQLSREQFYHRAASLKARAAQMHLQVESMAARASQSNMESIPEYQQ